MTLKARFSLIAVGILVFLIVTHVLILYARGFEYAYMTVRPLIVTTWALLRVALEVSKLRTEPLAPTGTGRSAPVGSGQARHAS